MKIFKEIVLAILILIVILVTMGIVLYDMLPSLKKIPKAQEYTKSLEAEKILDEVVNQQESQTAIKRYRMTKAELNSLSNKKRFDKGKSNPFADYTTKPTTSPEGSSSGGKIFDDSNKGKSK